MRHRAEFFFPDRLKKLGVPFRIVDQRPGETVVILPDAYHEGFSTGYTLAEAKKYAQPGWNTETYQPCETSCMLATAIPAECMRLVAEGEERYDLCAAFLTETPQRVKRGREEAAPGEDERVAFELEPEAKRSKL